ncbi:MAG: hypothetical protein WC788_07120 [Candidatus Paceibacterota bacterium]|jgi:hypothetical protein
MKQCEIKFVIDETLLEIIAIKFKIDLWNKEEANRKLEEFVKDYMKIQMRVTSDAEVKITDK